MIKMGIRIFTIFLLALGPIRMAKGQAKEGLNLTGDFAIWIKDNRIRSIPDAWAKLQRPDWMLELVSKRGMKLNKRKLRQYACDNAEQSLPLFEKLYPSDKGPRQAVEVARRFANADVTRKKLANAEVAAESAANTATKAAIDANGAGPTIPPHPPWDSARYAALAAEATIGSTAWNAATSPANRYAADTVNKIAEAAAERDANENAVEAAKEAVEAVRAAAYFDALTENLANAGNSVSTDVWNATVSNSQSIADVAAKKVLARQADRLRFYFPNPFRSN